LRKCSRLGYYDSNDPSTENYLRAENFMLKKRRIWYENILHIGFPSSIPPIFDPILPALQETAFWAYAGIARLDDSPLQWLVIRFTSVAAGLYSVYDADEETFADNKKAFRRRQQIGGVI
ncbi:9599_t:CDS:2, partial [Paraglomus brasilianum]